MGRRGGKKWLVGTWDKEGIQQKSAVHLQTHGKLHPGGNSWILLSDNPEGFYLRKKCNTPLTGQRKAGLKELFIVRYLHDPSIQFSGDEFRQFWILLFCKQFQKYDYLQW